MSKISGAMVAEKRHTCRAGQVSKNFNNKKKMLSIGRFQFLAHFHRAPVN
jgi:hypothetical protein